MKTIFVFGSNLAGFHGKGAAADARTMYRAKIGVAEGITGDAYAIPTKSASLKPLPLQTIRIHVERFLDYARGHLDLRFHVTAIGCGYAGYTDAEIAPMFYDAPINCDLPKTWLPYVSPSRVLPR